MVSTTVVRRDALKVDQKVNRKDAKMDSSRATRMAAKKGHKKVWPMDYMMADHWVSPGDVLLEIGKVDE